MTREQRRILTEAEKAQLRKKWPVCYICEEPLNGYDEQEVEYDHIYDFASGYSQDLSNFAPVHASGDPAKRNCHRGKGRRNPSEYKEYLRITRRLDSVSGLKDLCPKARQSSVEIDLDARTIELNGTTLPLYSQRINNVDNWYFFAEIPIEFLESDTEIQLRPLDSRILGLVFHLKKSLQLLPSLGRLDTATKRIRIFDGQHKAVAQIVGNNRKTVPCLVFVDPDVNALRVTVTDAHTTFLQQRYAPSHIDDKLATIYTERVKQFQGDDPDKPYSEKDILRHEPKGRVRQFLQSTIIDGLEGTIPLVDTFVWRSRPQQKRKPMSYQSLRLFVQTFAHLEAIDTVSGDPENFRAAELKNLAFLLESLYKHSLQDKWQPANPEAEEHKLAQLHYYVHAFANWVRTLDEALKHALGNMQNRAVRGALCHRREFAAAYRDRFDAIVQRLFTHSLWLNPANRPTLQSSFAGDISRLFEEAGLDYIYLCRLD